MVKVRSSDEVKSYFISWVHGWLEIWRLRLFSTKVVVEVKVGIELGNRDTREYLERENREIIVSMESV